MRFKDFMSAGAVLHIKWWWMRINTSPQTFTGVWGMRSSERPTAPSVEFSTGTTPKSAVPDSTARKTSSIDGWPNASAAMPKCFTAAFSLKVPRGPR